MKFNTNSEKQSMKKVHA